MNALSIEQRVDLRRRIAIWSDRLQKEAVAFSNRHSDLLPRRISNAQLSGLNNISQAALELKTVDSYIKNQAEKAERAGYVDLPVYWKELGDAFKQFPQDAETLLSNIGITAPDQPKSKEYIALLDEVCMMLAREWVQHLVAHSLLLASTSSTGN